MLSTIHHEEERPAWLVWSPETSTTPAPEASLNEQSGLMRLLGRVGRSLMVSRS